MHVLTHTIIETRQAIAAARAAGKTIGFVPTMGAARRACGTHSPGTQRVRVCRRQHFRESHTVRAERGFQPLSAHTARRSRAVRARRSRSGVRPGRGCDVPGRFRTFVEVERTGEGTCAGPRGRDIFAAWRLSCSSCSISFNPTVPTSAKRMLSRSASFSRLVRDLDVPTEIVVVPTVREEDGLAISSRNRYLEPADRQRATVLVQALREVRQRFIAGEHDARVAANDPDRASERDARGPA